MTFLMGWSILAIGTLAASIPIVIHLLHRQRTTPISWGAMQFLLESPLQSRRQKKVEHWLLLALRVASLLLLAWVLARPVSKSSRYNPLAASQPLDIAVVLDHSLSMGRKVKDHTAFDEARGAVDQVASKMRPGDTLSVVLAEHRPRALNDVPVATGQTIKLLETVDRLTPGLTDCSIPEAAGFARDLVNRGRNVRKLILIASDQQKTNWQIGDNAAWNAALPEAQNSMRQDVQTWLLPISPDLNASNISIGEVAIEPALVGINRPIQINAAVKNDGSKDVAAIDIHLTIDGKETGAPARIQKLGIGQSSTIHFDHTFHDAGSHWIRIWTDLVDALAADNSQVAAVQVWQKLPVLIIDGQLTSGGGFNASRFLEAAMQPVDPTTSAPALIQPTIVSVADSASVRLEDYDAVLLNDVPQLPPAMESKLQDYVESGHGVWIFLGPRTQPAFITETLGPQHAGLFRLSLKQPSPISAAKPPAISIKTPANPMVAMIAAAERNALIGAVVGQWWPIVAEDGDSQAIVTTTVGDPLILEHPVGSNGGRVVVWATSADGAWNNFPAMPNFVPLINETVYHLSAPQTQSATRRNLSAGAAIAWSGPPQLQIRSVDVTLPDGTIERGRKPLFRNGHWEFQYAGTFIPGLYTLRFSPTEVPQPAFFGVGIDRRELDPAALSDNDRRWLSDHHFVRTTSLDELPNLISQNVQSVEIWKWLALFVVFTLLLETAMTYRMIGLQKKPKNVEMQRAFSPSPP